MQSELCDHTGLVTALEWAAREGWNPGQHDAHTFYQADAAGFWLGRREGKQIASLSSVSWDDSFAFIGLYIVVPEERGRGYGWQLWQHVIASHPGKCFGLDGVVAQQSNYAKSGFQLAHRSLRWTGPAGKFQGEARHTAPLGQFDRAAIHRLDSAVSPADRPRYLDAWIDQPGAQAWGLSENGNLEGMVVARPGQQGWRIGPLIASTPEQADRLMRACCSELPPDTPIFVDTPEPNRAAQQLFTDAGLTVSFEVARMYTRPVRPHRLDWLYGVTSLELG